MPKKPKKTRRKKSFSKAKSLVSRILTPSVRLGKVSLPVDIKFNSFIIEDSVSNIKRHLPKLLENKSVRESFGAYEESIDKIGTTPIFDNLDPNKYLHIYTEIIVSEHEKINSFLQKRKEFENDFFQGNYDEANKTLEEVLDTYGYSIWYIRNKILLYAYADKIDQLSTFFTDIRSVIKSGIFSDYIKGYFWVIQSNDPIVTLEKMVINGTKELSDANMKHWAALQVLLFFPQEMYEICDADLSLKLLQFFPLVDLYTLLIDVSGYQITNANLNTNENPRKSVLKECLNRLSTVIDDEYLRKINEGLSGKESYSVCESGTKIIANYNAAKYEDAIDVFNEEFSQISCPTAYINIIGKCYAYLSESNKEIPSNPIGSLTKDFRDVYLLKDGISQTVYHIKGSMIKLHGLSSSASIFTALTKLIPHSFDSKQIKDINYFSLLTQAESTPLTESLAKGKLYYFDENNHPEIDTNGGIALYRERRQQINKKIACNIEAPTFEEAVRELGNDPLKKDMYESVSRCLIEREEYTKLLEFVSCSLIEEEESYVCFPLMKIADYIEDKQAVSLDSIIILSFLQSRVTNEKDYLLNETFEDYLFDKEVDKPSSLLGEDTVLSAKENFFFNKVCIPNVMDFLSVFESSIELKEERLKILAWMYAVSDGDKKRLIKEIEVLISEIIIDENASKIERSKIVINSDAIKKKKVSDIEALIELYIHADEDDSEDRFVTVRDADDETVEATVLSGSKNTIIGRMLNQITPVYLYDDDLGLDKNLSAEIRHGFFANLIRSRAEDRNIITEVNDEGEYQNNLYWREFYNILHENLLDGIDESLKEFSRKLNEKIEEAEEWMKVSVEGDHKERIFDYTFNSNDLSQLKIAIESTRDADHVSNIIIEILNNKTEHNINLIRDKLNIEFKESTDLLCDELISSIEDIKRVAQLNELISSVRMLKNEINSDITTVSEWFCVSENIEHEDMQLDFLIETAVACFKKIRGSSAIIKASTGESKDIDGKHVKSLIIVLINLLNNALDYGETKEQTEVLLSSDCTDDGFSFEVQNKISKFRYKSLLKGNLDKIIEKMRRPPGNSFLVKEGGTGLCKSYRKLKDLDEGFDVIPVVSDEKFTVRVSYGV